MSTKLRLAFGSMVLLSLMLFNYAKAQQQKTADTTAQYLNKLFSSKDTLDKKVLLLKLDELSKAAIEKEMVLAANYFYRLGNQRQSELLYKQVAERFPQGKQARQNAAQPIYKLTTATETEVAYKEWLNKFPFRNYENVKVDDRLIYDYVRSNIATKYAVEKNIAKTNEYAAMLEVDFWKGNAYSSISSAFYKNRDLQNAEIYAKKAMDNAFSYINDKKGTESWAKFAASGYAGLTSTYANIIFEEKKYDEALKFSEIAYKNAKSLTPTINYRYAQILMGLNRNQEAYNKLEEVVKEGKASEAMAVDFKKLYIKTKGSDIGFETYAAALRKSYLENLNKKLTKEMVKETAPGFTLKDIEGKTVSLTDYKGKIVILDFWATWCGPCKASFPAMQMAVNKFKEDSNVKFLFIHTWEQSETPLKDATDYIKNMKYTFNVIMDSKDAQTKTNKVVSAYKVKGIPAKFVIDAIGNIRFKLTGFDGSNEAAVDEITMMVDMAKIQK